MRKELMAMTTLVGALVGLGAPAEVSSEAADPSSVQCFRRGVDLFNQARVFATEHPTDRDEAARRYRQAAESFVAAWKAGAASTNVFTNIANSYFFAGALGEAVLFY